MIDYKKKYDEVLAKAKEIHRNEVEKRSDMEWLFPELKESEDEKIRKEIISFFKQCDSKDLFGVDISDWISWLEKQGEQKPKDRYTFNSIPRLLDMIEPTDRAKSYCQKLIDSLLQEGYTTDAKIVSDCLKQMNGEKVAMAVMDEQKPAKVEPKFKVGDWITDGKLNTARIININDDRYEYEIEYIGGDKCLPHIGYIDRLFHLWSIITDAKDGDVLKEDSCTFIIERMKSDWTAIVHCCLFDDGDFDLGSTLGFDVDSTYPATKEQCDQLEKAMKEAGYEWSEETHELKKISQRMISAETKEEEK